MINIILLIDSDKCLGLSRCTIFNALQTQKKVLTLIYESTPNDKEGCQPMNDNTASNKNFSSNKEIERDFLKNVAQGCYQCEGQTKPCRYCGVLMNWLNRNQLSTGVVNFIDARGDVARGKC